MPRRSKSIIALPEFLRLKEDGYELVAKITSGPKSMLGRRVRIWFTSVQLDKIDDWDPKDLLDTLVLEPQP